MIPQSYPLWFATRTDRAARIVAWTEVDHHEGLFPVVFWQGAAAAGPVTEKGWIGVTADEAMDAAAQAARSRPPAPPNLDDLPLPERTLTPAEALEAAHVRRIEERSPSRPPE